MKRILIISVLSCLLTSAFPQFNTNLIDETKMWSRMEYSLNPSWYCTSYYHKFAGDTIINEHSYKKVWQSDDEDHLFWVHIGFIRENEEGEIIYRDKVDNEGLMYKFNVAVGDTVVVVNSFMFNYTVHTKVVEIDSVYLPLINEKVKRIKLENIDTPGIFEEYWLEGIGSSAGLLLSGLHASPFTGMTHTSLCQWQNNSLVYTNTNFSYCFNTTVSTDEIKEESQVFTVYPNPMTSQSIIGLNVDDLKNCRVEIRDMLGYLIHKDEISRDEVVILKRRQFKPGMYFISLFEGKKLITKQKLLVI